MAIDPTNLAATAPAVPDTPTSPRKRRRRAPTTGAADDCFACQDRHTQCDRRRPYCTQCLDRGKDCSGYKTTLTWGVGVASRGKLRGLSLPVAKSKKVDPVEPDEDTPKKRKTAPSKPNTPTSATSQGSHTQSLKRLHPSSYPMTTTYGFINVDPNASTPSPVTSTPGFQWPMPNPPNRSLNQRATLRPNLKKGIRRHSLEPLHVPALQIHDFHSVPMTAGAFGGFADRYESAVECSPMTPGFRPHERPTYKEEFGTQGAIVASPMHGSFFSGQDIGSWPPEAMSSSISSDQSSRDFHEDDGFFADPGLANALDQFLGSQLGPIPQASHIDDQTIKEEALQDHSLILHEAFHDHTQFDDGGLSASLDLSRSIPSVTIGNTPGLRYFINYYDKVISPVIVAFDGPTNPYRTHILQLAQESETLQHAIAALSASNLRMRREHNPSATQGRLNLTDAPHDTSVRKSSLAHSLLNDDLDHLADAMTQPGAPSKEELHHKGESIRTLNAQLADPARRKDDSILATLLMLCLYHICETGVAKFKTQFAGVKKILALRGDIGTNSKDTAWLRTMFTWFDAMTATVNDREGQFPDSVTNPFNATSSADDEEWALENLAGCDGRLFSTIAKLGRLNLLSQGKPVAGAVPKKPASPPRTTDYYSMSNYSRIDGNGWAPLPHSDTYPDRADGRTQFWAEWTDIRQKLTDWSLTSTTLPPAKHIPVLEANRIDLLHISESFRYSAMLYTERLAYPSLPSSAPNFQALVSEALFYISQVKSDVYLLWPLFITGTECVEESQRDLIRGRCLNIQKDSGFFNNISGLELLERVWKEGDRERMRGAGRLDVGRCGGGGFKWRKAMEKVDGEYIVI